MFDQTAFEHFFMCSVEMAFQQADGPPGRGGLFLFLTPLSG